MALVPERVHNVETTWIREYAQTYLPTEIGFSFSAEMLRKAGISLVAVRNVFRRGYVVCSEKLDGPGAIWVVEGDDNGGDQFRLTIRVVSECLEVTLLGVEPRVREDDGDDAA